jgi:hypothetical protein
VLARALQSTVRQPESGGMSIVTNSTSATYSFSTGGASAVTWYAYQGETLLDTASGDSPSFDLSGATANVTITTDPETPSLSDLDCTGDTTLIEVNGVDLSSASGAQEDWNGCTSMTSFNATDIGGGSFYRAWRLCSSLTSFSALDLSGGTNFSSAWYGCTAMASFNATAIGAGLFSYAWKLCSSLTSFPALDLSSGSDFTDAWQGCLLDQQSTENVLVALDNGGASSLNTIIGTDGTSLSTAAAAAKTSLEGKGWTITIQDNS